MLLVFLSVCHTGLMFTIFSFARLGQMFTNPVFKNFLYSMHGGWYDWYGAHKWLDISSHVQYANLEVWLILSLQVCNSSSEHTRSDGSNVVLHNLYGLCAWGRWFIPRLQVCNSSSLHIRLDGSSAQWGVLFDTLPTGVQLKLSAKSIGWLKSWPG